MATSKSFIGNLSEFDSVTEPWPNYIERVEQFFNANDVPQEKRLSALLSCMGAKSYSTLRSLVAPDLPSSKTYGEIVQVLQNHFAPRPLVIAERFRFYKRDQGESEGINEFLASLRRLSEYCAFGPFLNEALRDKLVCGLRSEGIQKRLLSEADLSLSKATEIGIAMETASKDAEELQGKYPNQNDVHRFVRYQEGKDNNTIFCYRCGDKGHKANACRFSETVCRTCHKKGHLAAVCRSQFSNQTSNPKMKLSREFSKNSKIQVRNVSKDSQDEDTDNLIATVTVHNFANKGKAIWICLEIEGIPIKMELDTGSAVSIIPAWLYNKHLTHIPLKPVSVRFKTYSGEQLEPLGKLLVQVQYGKQTDKVYLYVLQEGVPLFGREWLTHFQINFQEIFQIPVRNVSNKPIPEKLEKLLSDYQDIFADKLGTLVGSKAKLHLLPNVVPVFCKSRPVSYALRPLVETELDRLEAEGVITKTSWSEWATPIVPVPKPDGTVRICGDFKVTVNPSLKVDQYPMPTVEDIFSNLSGGQKFSKIDLRHAYLQIEMEEDSKKLLTINTQKGLYQYNRLALGIASAPAIWQKTIDKVIQGCKRTQGRLDDLIVTGDGDEDHLRNLEMVLERLQTYNLKVNKNKCLFFQDEVEFCGHKIDKQGIHKMQDKIEAVTKAPQPRTVSEVRSFLGLVNYYAKFLPNVSHVLSPLNDLLKKDRKWHWSPQCEDAFKAAKTLVASEMVLCHYTPDLPLKIACDAAPNGLGCVLSHVFNDGSERPIAFASRSLTQTEQSYSQIDREALGIVWGIKRFFNYIFGRHFILVTDNKPLTAIFAPDKAIPLHSAARLQRYALFLSSLDYEVEYKPTLKHANADGLSRLPLPNRDISVFCEELDSAEIFQIAQLEKLPVTTLQVQQETRKDPLLAKVYTLTKEGWPDTCSDIHLQPYFQRRTEITICQGVLLWGFRVIIPESLQKSLLKELHSGHVGVAKMKGIARSYLWWSGLDKALEETARNCNPCTDIQNAPPKTSLHPWEWPSAPWRRVHVDFAGPFMDKMYLVIVDAHSKWPEVVAMTTTTTQKTVDVLRLIFARNGLPEQLVSDNGPQFTSTEFQSFMLNNGIKHIKTAPYHPATNGLAERFVQTLKQGLRAEKAEGSDPNKRLANFLMAYRNAPHATTKESPAQLFLGRTLKSKLDLIKPDIRKTVEDHQSDLTFSSNRTRHFQEGQPVSVRDYRGSNKKQRATISTLSYTVSVGDGTKWRRHAEQIRSTSSFHREDPVENLTVPVTLTYRDQTTPVYKDQTLSSHLGTPLSTRTVAGKNSMQESGAVTEGLSRRYPDRIRMPPKRLDL